MKNITKRNMLIGIAAVAVVAGVLIAVLASGGGGGSPRSATVARLTSQPDPTAVAPAAGYLGIAPAKLRAEVRGGKTLGQIARETPGKSVAGLLHATVAARRAQLAAELAAGKISPAQEKTRLAELNRRTAEQVAGTGVPVGDVPVASRYLGVSSVHIRAQLRAGKSLAEVAEASGKSASGLVAAIVSARQARLASEVAAGTLSTAEEQELLDTLERRVTVKVDRRRGHGAATAAPTSTSTAP